MARNDSNDEEVPEIRYLDGGWGWVVMIASFLSQSVIGSMYFGYGILLPEWMDEFQSSSAVTSLVGSTVGGVISASGPFASWMILKTSCRTTHILGGVLLALSAIACSFATNIVQIFIFYSVTAGIGGSLCYISSVLTLSQYFKHRRSVAIGVASSGIGFGSFVFPVIYEYLIEYYGWREVMLISGAIYGNMIAFGMIMCPITKAPKLCATHIPSVDHDTEVIVDINHNEISKEPQSCKPPRINQKNSFQMMRAFVRNPLARRKSSFPTMTKDDAEVLSQLSQKIEAGWEDDITEENESMFTVESNRKITRGSDAIGYKEQLFKLFKLPLFYVLIFHNITLLFGMMITYGLTALRAVTDYSMTTKQGALLVSITGLANLFGRLLWGIIASSKKVNATTFFLSLRIASGILVLASNLTKSFTIYAINCAMTGLAFGNYSLYPVMLSDLFGDRLLAIVFGYLETATGIGGILGPLCGGYLYDLTGTYQYSFVASGVAILIGVVPFPFIFLYKKVKSQTKASAAVTFHVGSDCEMS